MNENMEEIAKAADRIENFVASMGLPGLTASMHIEILKESLPEISQQIKQAVIAETGEDPWEAP